jgi:hypothetical protein
MVAITAIRSMLNLKSFIRDGAVVVGATVVVGEAINLEVGQLKKLLRVQ